MEMRSELIFGYDEETSFVVSAVCSRCGEKMLAPDPKITLSRDRVFWFATRFLEHKGQCDARPALREAS